MVMFFNVKGVRDYLLEHNEVYTLRKKRFRIGNDTAVKGNRFKKDEPVVAIAKIVIAKELSEPVTEWNQLLPYVTKSGLYGQVSPEGIELEIKTCKTWLALAQKLSGTELFLYHIYVISLDISPSYRRVISEAL